MDRLLSSIRHDCQQLATYRSQHTFPSSSSFEPLYDVDEYSLSIPPSRDGNRSNFIQEEDDDDDEEVSPPKQVIVPQVTQRELTLLKKLMEKSENLKFPPIHGAEPRSIVSSGEIVNESDVLNAAMGNRRKESTLATALRNGRLSR